MLKHKQDSSSIDYSISLLSGIFILVTLVGGADGSPYVNYFVSDIFMSSGTDTSVNTYNPIVDAFPGFTPSVSGLVPNLLSKDEVNMGLRSYLSGTDTEDCVDNNTSDVDESEDIGTHGNFTAQKYGPDLINDTITEGDIGVEPLELWVDGFTADEVLWDEVGASPYLDAIDFATNYIWATATDNEYEGKFSFANSSDLGIINDVKICVYAMNEAGDDEEIEVYLYNSTGGPYSIVQFAPTAGSWGWYNYSCLSTLPNWTEVNTGQLRVRAEKIGGGGNVCIDAALILVNYTGSNYLLDLEVQWTNVNYDEANEELCIYGGTMGTENIRFDVWNGTAWQNLFTDLTSGWNNVSVSSYLNSSTFTGRFKGSIETGDTTQDTWNIDVVFLHMWSGSPQPFDWFTTLLYILPLVLVLLFILALKRKRRKTIKPHIGKKPDSFSESFEMTHQQMIGQKMLLEIDPTSDFHKALSSFVSEAKKSDELLFILTSKTSTLHSAFSEDPAVKFLLLTSKTSSSQRTNKNETLLPATDLSVLLDVFAKIQKAESKKTINVLFDNISDIILRCGFEKTYKFTRFLLEAISSPRTTALFLFNPTAHEPSVSSSIRGLFQIHLAYTKRGLIAKTSLQLRSG